MEGNHFPGLQDSWIEEPWIHWMLWIHDIFRKVALGKIPEVLLCSLKEMCRRTVHIIASAIDGDSLPSSLIH